MSDLVGNRNCSCSRAKADLSVKSDDIYVCEQHALVLIVTAR